LPRKMGRGIVVGLTTGTSRGQPRSTKHALLHPMHPKSGYPRQARADDLRSLQAHWSEAAISRTSYSSCVGQTVGAACSLMLMSTYGPSPASFSSTAATRSGVILATDGHWNGRWIAIALVLCPLSRGQIVSFDLGDLDISRGPSPNLSPNSSGSSTAGC
jgi:hypothetical protein